MTDNSLINPVSMEIAGLTHSAAVSKLPRKAELLLSALPIHVGRVGYKWQGLHAAVKEALAAKANALATQRVNQKRYGDYNRPVPEDIAAADAAHCEATAIIAEQALKDLEAVNAVYAGLQTTLRKTEAWVAELKGPVGHVDTAEVSEAVSPVEGKAAALTKKRANADEVAKIKNAVSSAAEVFTTFKGEVDKLAAPPPYDIVWSGNTPNVRIPLVYTGGESRGHEIPHAPDPTSWLVRTFYDDILEEGQKAIDDRYAYENLLVLTPEEKRSQLAKLADDLLAAHRLEASHVWRGLEQGEDITFSADIDPRAVLGVDGPRPPKHR